MKYITALILATMVTFSSPINDVLAKDNSVTITIPKFKVSVNEDVVDSTVMKYPMIVYNDITYFPLTWDWCRKLGLTSGYTKEEGLYIANYTSQSQEILDAGNYQAAGSKHTALIPTYPVFINGEQIDNSKETYPLINFRNITYFPLTWRFVVDEFGWEESWNNTSGFKLSTYGSLKEHLPGTHYNAISSYIVENYRDYSIVEKLIEERFISTEPNEHGEYSDNYVDRRYEYSKLDYDTNTLMKIESKETEDIPYDSGSVKGEEVSELFTSDNSTLSFKGDMLLDLSKDAGSGNSIDNVYATKHNINGMKVYLTSVFFTQGSISIPAPYTPSKNYVFIDKGDNVLHHLDSWPTDQTLSDIYPYGKDGIYLSSKGRIFGSARHNNGRGLVCLVKSDLSVTTLNDKWEDWNSLDAIGTDDAGNLYLLNTWFPDFESISAGSGIVSPIRDGYFRLDLNGQLTKIYPFVHGEATFVTPSGQVYLDTNWGNAILHLQSNTKIKTPLVPSADLIHSFNVNKLCEI